jgi:hypothetical protein
MVGASLTRAHRVCKQSDRMGGPGWTVKDGISVHRTIEVLPGMSEADVMRGILLRLADTATSLVAEARRLNTLAVPAVIRYC